jgi:hypothetical protein
MMYGEENPLAPCRKPNSVVPADIPPLYHLSYPGTSFFSDKIPVSGNKHPLPVKQEAERAPSSFEIYSTP